MPSQKRRGRGEGAAFYEAAKGRWVATIDLPPGPGGKRRRRKVSAETKWEVQERLRKLQKQADDGRLPDAGSATVGEFLNRRLESRKGKVAAHTYLPYERDCNRYLIPTWGGRRSPS
jgi:hypothetical protein